VNCEIIAIMIVDARWVYTSALMYATKFASDSRLQPSGKPDLTEQARPNLNQSNNFENKLLQYNHIRDDMQ
jgi:hypothetical protein